MLTPTNEKRTKDLGVLREQLHLMIEFMDNTPNVNGSYAATEWCNELPAYPNHYTVEEWQSQPDNIPVWYIWWFYKAELELAGFYDLHKEAEELPIADLLAASRVLSETTLGDKMFSTKEEQQ